MHDLTLNSIRPKISALIITRNEEQHIREVIENVSFADEILVVDSFSTDRTVSLIRELDHVKLIQHPFKNFADQRNFAIEQARYEWILFVDADERIPKALKAEILKVVGQQSDIVAYKFPRKFVFENRIVHFSGLQTDYIFRLFRKERGRYKTDRLVHEQLVVDGGVQVLDNYMLHYSFSTYDHYKNKTEHYARLKALELFDRKKKPTLIDHYVKPLYKFAYNYVLRLGILDGKAGYTICSLNAYGVAYRYKELKRLYMVSTE